MEIEWYSFKELRVIEVIRDDMKIHENGKINYEISKREL
jgi:hypothetical protein